MARPAETADAEGHAGSHDDPPLTLQRLLEERLLREHEVISSLESLAAPISWCRSLVDAAGDDAPLDGVVVVAPMETLSFDVLNALYQRGAAGLLVRGGSRAAFEGLDPPARLPVVAIPARVRADELARQVARLSLAHESHVLQYAQTVHGALASLLHRGAGVDALTALLERLSGCPVAVLDNQMKLSAFAEGRQTWMDPTSVGTACRDLLQGGLPATGSEQDATGHGHANAAVVSCELKGRRVTCVVGAIELADQREGWIVLLDPNDPPHEHDLAEHKVVVQQAATIVGTELLRVRGIERAEERARGNFVHALLHGRFSTQADLAARAAHHDFPVDSRFGVVVVQARGLIAEDDSPIRLGNMAREAGRIQHTEQRRTMSAVVGDVIAVVREVAQPSRSGPDQGARELTAFAAALARRLQGQTERAVLVSYGRPVSGARHIGDSYREARMALGLSAQLKLPAPTSYTDLRVPSTLLGLAQEQVGREFAREILEPLRGAAGDLVDAVRAYVAAGGNLNQAARDLSVHRNTMLYKLERASKALNLDVRDPEAQFAVWLALKLDLLALTADAVERDIGTS
jgi:sugar diacid utilization regulator